MPIARAGAATTPTRTLVDPAAARTEVVEILAGAIFTLILKGETPSLRVGESRPAASAPTETHSAPVPS
jgi:hypothetical protein